MLSDGALYIVVADIVLNDGLAPIMAYLDMSIANPPSAFMSCPSMSLAWFTSLDFGVFLATNWFILNSMLDLFSSKFMLSMTAVYGNTVLRSIQSTSVLSSENLTTSPLLFFVEMKDILSELLTANSPYSRESCVGCLSYTLLCTCISFFLFFAIVYYVV